MKLICNPLRTDSSTPATIAYVDAYDMYELGAFKKGVAEVTASFHLDGDAPTLLCEIEWHPKGSFRPSAATSFSGSITLPLWFHRGSSCVLVALDKVEDKLPPEAFVEHDTAEVDMVHAEIHVQHEGAAETTADSATHMVVTDADPHVEHDPPVQSPPALSIQAGTTSTNVPISHELPQGAPFANVQTGIPTRRVSLDREPSAQHTPLANVQAGIPSTRVSLDRVPPVQDTAHANIQARMPAEMCCMGATPETGPSLGRQLLIPGAEVHVAHRLPSHSHLSAATAFPGRASSGPIAPLANMDPTGVDRDAPVTGGNAGGGYTGEGSKKRKASELAERLETYSKVLLEPGPGSSKNPNRQMAPSSWPHQIYIDSDTTEEE